MVDVVICYSSDNAATAGQLAEAVTRRGYTLWSEEALTAQGASGAVTERIGDAKAAIVIWSEAAAASEWIRAEANYARGQKKLIQLSADDRPPPLPFNAAETISIASWLGDEEHSAWHRICAALEALCGPPREAKAGRRGAGLFAATPPPPPPPPPPPTATALAASASASDPAPPAAASSTPSPAAAARPAATRRGPWFFILAIAFAAVVAVAAALWMRSQPPISAEAWKTAKGDTIAGQAPPPAPVEPLPASVAPPPIAPPLPAESFSRQGVVRDPGGAVVRNAPSPLGISLARLGAGETFATAPPAGAWWRVRTASGITGYVSAAQVRLSEPPPASEPKAQVERRPAGPRINRRNSENMRRFCEGAGRGTPQCRTFARQLRNQER